MTIWLHLLQSNNMSRGCVCSLFLRKGCNISDNLFYSISHLYVSSGRFIFRLRRKGNPGSNLPACKLCATGHLPSHYSVFEFYDFSGRITKERQAGAVCSNRSPVYGMPAIYDFPAGASADRTLWLGAVQFLMLSGCSICQLHHGLPYGV